MAVNTSRSLNHDLGLGSIDGKYKQVATRERGGVVEPATALARQHLHPQWYGTGTEAPTKVTPTGRVIV